MRRVLKIALATAVLGFASTATPAIAGSGGPTQHGFCTVSSGASTCIDNGTNTPTPVNPPTFGFSASPGPATGDLLLAILIPNNDAVPSPLTVSGFLTGTFTLHSGVFNSGDLTTFLGLTGSPPNPIGAYLPAAQALDPGATGFFVLTHDFGTQTLPSNGGISNSFLSTLGQSVSPGTYITAFLTTSAGTGTTAQSGAILETGGVPEPATWAMMLLGFGGIGMAMRRSRRSATLMQVA